MRNDHITLLVSCISTQHSTLKKHWKQSREETMCPLTVLGSRFKPEDAQYGTLAMVDGTGKVHKRLDLVMPAGLTCSERGVLVAAHGTIHEVTPELELVQADAVSLPAFSMLHSLARTKHGYLVSSTGVDALVEFTHSGEVVWEWWATEHGFTQTPTGEERVLDKTLDHRTVKYGTLAQTTHVNSAAELPDGRILASLFHQGMVICIDRESGSWEPVLEGLDHSHSIRVLNQDYFTLADTGHGRALLVSLREGRGKIESEVAIDTNWLQDARYDYGRDLWFLVDGKNSRIVLRSGLSGQKPFKQIDLDPEWRLYEALPL